MKMILEMKVVNVHVYDFVSLIKENIQCIFRNEVHVRVHIN